MYEGAEEISGHGLAIRSFVLGVLEIRDFNSDASWAGLMLCLAQLHGYC
jgi:hypothetical protein